MAVLGIDTSNYATSLAVVNRAGEVVLSMRRLLPVPEGALGLRQSEAMFRHTVALPEMMEECRRQGAFAEVDTVGVSSRPRPVEGSYMPCFAAGVNAAAAFAAALGGEAICTSHQQGHLAAALHGAGVADAAGAETLFFHLSGGTTELLHCRGYEVLALLGQSEDLHAGQAVDRLGVKLGFAFPAGADVSRLALACDEEMEPRATVRGGNCHLSGLQNQCERLLAEGREAAYVAKFCLLTIADAVRRMVAHAREKHPALPVVLAGGVMASDVVRPWLARRLENACFAPAELAGDNAVGVALIALAQAATGRLSG